MGGIHGSAAAVEGVALVDFPAVEEVLTLGSKVVSLFSVNDDEGVYAT